MQSSEITVVIETPKESRLKFKFDKVSGRYKVDRILAKGLRFPFNFGFVPQTQAPDGDPTDILLIIDEILFPGCCLDCRVLGVVRAEQSEKGKIYRNDRILAVSVKDADAPKSIDELERNFVLNVERFFATYHQAEGNRFEVIGIGNAEEALELVRQTMLPKPGGGGIDGEHERSGPGTVVAR
jgi:inorganic pyrophosphatase